MEIRAYGEEYLDTAQKILGDMMDYAVNICEMDADSYFGMFLASGIAREFERGNPHYVAGITGCELVREVVVKCTGKSPKAPEEMYLDKSPEYWAGWALAYYQWYTGKAFCRIHKAVSVERLLEMYPVYHESDLMKFVETMDEILEAFYVDTNLKRIRTDAGLSQNELARLSGIPLRQIQLFEQRQRDINKTQAVNIFMLSRVLGCESEALLEI